MICVPTPKNSSTEAQALPLTAMYWENSLSVF